MVKYQIYVECLEQSLQLQLELERQAQQEQLDVGGGQLRAEQRTEADLEADLARLIVHDGPL